jgi:hypothetical protein
MELVIMDGFEDQVDYIKENELPKIGDILDPLINRLRAHDINNDERRKLYESGSTGTGSQLEYNILNRLVKVFDKWWKRLDKFWDDRGSIIRKVIKWLKKIFKAINTILDSLKAAFPQLESLKQLKDHLDILTED